MRSPDCLCHVCLPEQLDDPHDQRCVDDVRDHGWHVLAVFNDDDTDDQRTFAYTIGLVHGAGHPELVMSGRKVDLMHHALNAAARRVMDGHPLHPGMTLENVIGRFPVLVDAMTDEGLDETVLFSHWFHRRRVEAFHLVWPDTRGIWACPGGFLSCGRVRSPPTPRGPSLPPPTRWAFSCECVVQHGAPVGIVTREPDGEGARTGR